MKTTTAKRILTLVSVILVLSLAMSGCAPATTGDAAAGGAGTAGAISMIPMLIVMIAVMYFFMIRPEKKRKKEAEDLRNSLATGDKIVTIGGMTGKIVNVSGDEIVFETGEDRVRIQVKKWAVSRKEGKENKDSKESK